MTGKCELACVYLYAEHEKKNVARCAKVFLQASPEESVGEIVEHANERIVLSSFVKPSEDRSDC